MIRSRLLRAATLAALVLSLFRAVAFAAEAASDEDDPSKATGKLRNPGSRQAAAEIAPASSAAADALQRFKLPPGLVARLWAAEPMLANPVAFDIDAQGRIYVAETYRYGSSTLDIRSYMWTLEDDLANRTTAEWLTSMKRHFGPEGLKELSLESERIRLLEDTKRTGVADKSTLYAEGFNSPQDGVASGVLARRGQVWFANIPNLWMLQGESAAAAGPAVKRTAISSGYGVRFNFTGHDLHGLVFGPDGKLYFSIGDRGAHATGPDGSVADTPDSGAVFRCNPDGTQLELFATGLRNPQSLVFTENGDLFTGDNDCDQGDEERLVHVVEGGDSGWRVGYQFPPLVKDGPWLREKLWHPRHAGQAAYLLAPICNIEDGPSGLTYYPGTGLNDSYRGALFITHFKGSISNSGIYTYNLKQSGATYAVADAKPFLTNALPTDVKFAPDGRLFYSDWADGWPKSKRGRLYAISDPSHEKDTLVLETEKIIGSDWTKKSSDELAKLLAHPDWRVRLEAQFTLAERGAESIKTFSTVATSSNTNPYPLLHAVWGLGQLAPKNPAALDALRSLLRDPKVHNVRGQIIKLLGDHGAADQAGAFIAALTDSNSRVKFFAAQSLGKIKHTAAAPALLDALRTNDDKDNYLRHALVMGLVGGNNLPALAAAITSDSRAVRLGVLLALRRLGRPEIAKFLTDSDPLIVREAAIAINDAPIVGAYSELAAITLDQLMENFQTVERDGRIGRLGITSRLTDESTMLRALNAHFRLGKSENAAALATYAANSAAPAKLRAEALNQLALWTKPPQRDRLVGTFRPLADKTRDVAVVKNVVEPILPTLLDAKSPDVVQSAALDLLVKLELGGGKDALFTVVANAQAPAATRASALTTMDKVKHARLNDALKIASESDASELRLAALAISTRISPEATAPVLASLVTRGTVQEQKTALRSLGFSRHATAAPLLVGQLKKLAAGSVPPAVQLDLLNAAGRRSEPAIKQLLADRDAALAKNPDPLAPYRATLEGGDARRGGRIFQNQPTMACVRCHRVGTDSGGEAGPNLAGIGAKQSREHLLESIVKPNAKIAPGFDTVIITKKSGGVVVGIVASETADRLNLRDTDSKLHEVQKSDIAKREGAPSGMPEIYGTILTKTELRDVVEYLASLKDDAASGRDARPRALRGM
ncbi:MAG: HEAT repeat domain-containing protein [Verrucomicrobia bacterium]|nr:HEAT repeat domain-containing protein [Verrucomicrobiota bacterium]